MKRLFKTPFSLFSRTCWLLLLAAIWLHPAGRLALAAPAASELTSVREEIDLQKLRSQLDKVQAELASPQPEERMQELREVATRSVVDGQAAAVQLAPKLAEAKARLAELGAAPTTGKEAPEIARLRKESQDEVAALDTKVKLAKLLAVEGQQAEEQIRVARRSAFQSELSSRTPSILSDRFWRELQSGSKEDFQRTEHLVQNAWRVARAIPATAIVGALVLAALVVLLRFWLGRGLPRLLAARVPAGRLRRSLYAFLHVVLSALTPLVLIEVVALGLSWLATQDDEPQRLLRILSGPLCFGGFVAGLGQALLSAERPSWRLLPMPDNVANGLRYFPLVLASVMVLAWLADRFYGLLDTSLATTVAVHCILALAMGGVLVLAVMRGRRLRDAYLAEQSASADGAQGETNDGRDGSDSADGRVGSAKLRKPPLWLQLAAIGVWLVLLGGIASLLLGYVAFGSFMLRQVVWSTLVVATAYLLGVLIVDVCEAWQGQLPDNTATEDEKTKLRLHRQLAVWVSGGLRLVLLALAMLLVVAPVGEGPLELFARGNTLGQGLMIGQVSLRPGLLLQAALVLVVCLVLVRLLRRWLRDSLMPTTRMDAGMRTSVLTLVNYVGIVAAVALTLSAVGISLQGIAWVASALSVGIGFGLQAVVQNFVSGLILLAERPVKVGDWVKLDTVEGDIRRINVRATEIQLGDRSTVIVPNSELITKAVRNITMANPLGRVQVLLPMPLDTHAAQVRSLLLAAMAAQEGVLSTPEPSVALEGLDAQGRLMFMATCFVDSPRNAYNTRSALWFVVLEQLRLAGLPLHPTQRMQLSGAAEDSTDAAASKLGPPAALVSSDPGKTDSPGG
ncbi:DUF3772 domain-containing protein [Variovorax sp. HJSM1_2]|uniref:DUF3772 domain-containing protein n=1 Tax=Variovorax sp. HJSM1_2 TaxID=3366263 RepID=UPI003BC6C545